MSRTFSMNSGSSETLNDSTICGCNPKVRQMPAHGGGADAIAPAILRVLQWAVPSAYSRIRG